MATTTTNRAYPGRVFGQVVLGPPGSGKTTYVRAVSEFFARLDDQEQTNREKLGLPGRLARRRPIIVNLDPGNEGWSGEEIDVDVCDLITVRETQSREDIRLGPNGGAIFAAEVLEREWSWIAENVRKSIESAGEQYPDAVPYLLIDMPGQIELVTHHESTRSLLTSLRKALSADLVAVHLVDSTFARDASKFISVSLLSLLTMGRLEMPHINVLSKADLMRTEDGEEDPELDFPLQFYRDMSSIHELTPYVDKHQRFKGTERGEARGRLYTALCDMIDEYGLVAYETLDVGDPVSLATLLRVADKAVGLVV